MPLVTSTEMFKKAYDGGYAIGAFNVNNMEIVQGITEACQEEHAPVILQVSKGARAYANHTYLVKLVLQPILENALNYGIRELDDFGEIVVGGQKVGEDIIITVSDNGMGIPENEIPLLLTNTDRVHKKGSGVGLVNVNNRIKILFGERYGLHIESELDEGTVVTIKIPAIVYSEENRLQFEEHHIV